MGGRAVEESLQGVSYRVNFERPADAGGSAAGKKLTLTFDAMALVADVQQIVEVEFFGSTDAEPAFLVFDNHLLPPHMPIHFGGIDDNGKTVVVAKERPPPTEDEQMMLANLLGAGMPGMGAGGEGFGQLGDMNHPDNAGYGGAGYGGGGYGGQPALR